MKNLITKPHSISAFLVLIILINTIFACSSASKSSKFSLQETVKNDHHLQALDLTQTIPIAASSWVVNNVSKDQKIITKSGILNWSSLDDVIRTYIKTGAGDLHIGLNVKSPDGTSKIKVTVGQVSKSINLTNNTFKTEKVGIFTVPAGYNYIEIQGLEKTGELVAEIKDLLIGGSAIAHGVDFVPTNNFYFGRRGPSVHLLYNKPPKKEVQWFYNEVTVPKGEDVLGSFFMVNGHAQGYFGMQVNSNSERRILFSIWSAYKTDNPDQIPEDFKVTNLGNGEGVTVQDFGNEGSGKQSFKVFNWQAGTTYKFLLKGEPSVVEGSTDYTGYFYNPIEGRWQLIASLRRPKTKTYLTRLHSFLENFIPSTGYIAREARFGNQWVYTTDNTWNEITNTIFSADATAINGDRLDYAGGTIEGTFFLRNCGFFNNKTNIGEKFSRPAGTWPNINFETLPKIPAHEQNRF
ncbi:DUF3472 domain-containing protein [Gelatiniphilus marinus]|uniref:DUF3472 domain-containing protein n=1 Tax=Gelatiniphilus marinus TaxID=1759464 RepID=A0ABW5JVV0_9FLAO